MISAEKMGKNYFSSLISCDITSVTKIVTIKHSLIRIFTHGYRGTALNNRRKLLNTINMKSSVEESLGFQVDTYIDEGYNYFLPYFLELFSHEINVGKLPC